MSYVNLIKTILKYSKKYKLSKDFSCAFDIGYYHHLNINTYFYLHQEFDLLFENCNTSEQIVNTLFTLLIEDYETILKEKKLKLLDKKILHIEGKELYKKHLSNINEKIKNSDEQKALNYLKRKKCSRKIPIHKLICLMDYVDFWKTGVFFLEECPKELKKSYFNICWNIRSKEKLKLISFMNQKIFHQLETKVLKQGFEKSIALLPQNYKKNLYLIR